MRDRFRLVAGILLLGAAMYARPASAVFVLDLTTAGASGTIGTASFVQVNNQSTGTGLIDPFVRLQNTGSEQGFNTDYRPLSGDLADVNSSAQFTHSIFVNQFGVVNYNNTPSIRFLLDINQMASNPLLSLDQMKVYVANAPDIHTNADLFSQQLIYDMDALQDSRVHLDYRLENGSGSGDMYAYLPVSLFAGHENQYLYLYSQFGAEGGDYATNDGFEEWARIDNSVQPPPPGVPEPRTAVLMGVGLLAVALARRNAV